MSSNAKKSLLVMPDEVISEVLSHCDVEDLLHVEQTCKRLQKICHERDVWRSQLESLDIDCAPSLPPFHRLQTMNVSSLRHGAVNGVRARDVWSNPNTMKLVKEDEIHFTEEVITRPVEPRMIPGGDEVIFARSGKLEVWSLTTHEHLWTAPPPQRSYFCTSLDFEVVENGRAVMIACEYSSPDDMPESSLVRIYRYERGQKNGEFISEWVFPPTYLHDLEIRGDFFMIFFSGSFQRVLVNWKTACGVVLDFEGESGPFNFLVRHTTLIDTHVLAVVNQEDEIFVFAMPLTALDGHWTFSNHFSDWHNYAYNPHDGPMVSLSHPSVPEKQVDESVSEAGMFSPDDGIWILSTHVFKPSWKPDAPTEMFIIGYSLAWAKVKRLISYRVHLNFSLPPAPTTPGGPMLKHFPDVRLTLVDASCADAPSLPWDKQCVFNSGHLICLRKPMRCFKLFTNERQPVCELEVEDHPWEWNSMHPVVTSVDPWSGRIIAATKGCLLIYRIE